MNATSYTRHEVAHLVPLARLLIDVAASVVIRSRANGCELGNDEPALLLRALNSAADETARAFGVDRGELVACAKAQLADGYRGPCSIK